MSSTSHNRRDVIKRAAAVGLVAVPGASLLSACAAGGGSDDSKKPKGPSGKKTAKNPLEVSATAPLEVVVFDGGFSTKYVDHAVDTYRKNFPKAKVKNSGTQDIAPKLQPRFASSTPPDLIDNSGAKAMDTAGLATKGVLQNLNELLDAPSFDDPDKKVRDTLRPGVVEQGQYGDDNCYAMNYAFTVYGVWYSQKLMKAKGWEYPETWDDMIKLCGTIKKAGIAPWTYAGRYPYYVHFTMFPLMAKIGGPDVLKKIDNLEPKAFQQPAVKQAVEMYHELAAKGFIMDGSPGLTHIQSQTAWGKGKAVFLPNGSWVENESRTVLKDFDLAVNAPTGADKSDKMPFPTTRAVAGEPYIVPAKGKNPRGGMEVLRIMLSKKSSLDFAQLVSSLPALDVEMTGFTPPPGLASAGELLKKVGDNLVMWRLPDWYQKLERDQIGQQLTGELMANRMKPDEWVRKAQKFADQTAKDSSVKKFKR